MNVVIPWSELLSLIAPHARAGKTGRSPFVTELMIRIHCSISSYKIHRSHLVDRLRHCQRLRLLTHKALARLDPLIELQLFIDSKRTLVVPFKTLDVTQVQIAKTEAPVAMLVGQSNQPSGHFVVLSIELALVEIAGLVDAK